MDVEPVRAAGGIIRRRSPTGETEVLVIHRPRYDDWSFPKGKCEPEETDEQCAIREVEEETGYRTRLGDELGDAFYFDRRGRSKTVRYWRMEAEGGFFTPNDEVDRADWVRLDDALNLLSYDHDLAMVEELLEDEIRPAQLLLVRHGAAGSRHKWQGDDRKRPIDEKGRRQSEALVEKLAPYPIDRIVTSPYLRCVQTVEPLAERLGLDIETADELAEGASPKEIDRFMRSLNGEVVVACTHGDVVQELLGPGVVNKKGGVWVLEKEKGTLKPARYLAPGTSKG